MQLRCKQNCYFDFFLIIILVCIYIVILLYYNIIIFLFYYVLKYLINVFKYSYYGKN
jgi:hypothetical protein